MKADITRRGFFVTLLAAPLAAKTALQLRLQKRPQSVLRIRKVMGGVFITEDAMRHYAKSGMF